jgi:hypothetical protein
MSLKQNRRIGIQLLGSMWISAAVLPVLVPIVTLTILIHQFVFDELAILIPCALLLIAIGVFYGTLPLWGVIKLAQARKDYGDEQVKHFIAWLEADDESTFEFTNQEETNQNDPMDR